MFRHAFTLISVVSFLLAVAVGATYLRAQRDGSDGRVTTVHVAAAGGRYALDWQGMRLVLSGPPPQAPANLDEATARTRWFPPKSPNYPWSPEAIPACTRLPDELAAAMRNEDLVWQVYLFDGRLPHSLPKVTDHDCPRGRLGTPTSDLAPCGVEGSDELCVDEAEPALPPWRLPPYTLAQTARPLLAALEDEKRWVAAHVALRWIARSDERAGLIPAGEWPDSAFQRRPDDPDRFTLETCGLHADLHAVGPETSWICCYRAPQDGRVRDCQVTIDPAQRGALLDWWHRRLDVQVAAVGLWPLVAGTLVAPMAWTAVGVHRRLRRRRRARAGLCLKCGYDLRASPGPCPECGNGSAP